MPKFVDAEMAPIYLNTIACEQIKLMPIYDNMPIIHAHWITNQRGIICSNCKKATKGNKSKYCPNCAALMDSSAI